MASAPRKPVRTASCFLAGLLALPALAGDPHFERIGPSRGLLAGEIRAIHQDRAGFLWIGTSEGLLLYDGYDFTTFDRDPSDPGSVADNQIRAIHEDRDGRLWVGTSTGGLDLLDRTTWTFEHHRHDPGVPGSIPDDGVWSLLEDREGTLWVGTQKGLTRLDRSTSRFDPLLAPGWVIDLLEDREGGIWVAMFGRGVLHRPAGSSEFRAVEVAGAPENAPFGRARCLAQDAFGTIWAGVAGGLLRFDAVLGTFEAVEIPIGPGGPAGLPTASDLAASPDGTLWVATPGGGLVEMDPKTGSGHRHREIEGVGNSLSSDNVQALHRGRDGTLWIGTGEGTLNQLRPGTNPFTVRKGAGSARDYGEAVSIFEDDRGALWIGSFGRGFDVIDLESGAVLHEGRIVLANTGEGATRSMFPARDGGAWVGTTIGLGRFDASGSVVRWWRSDPRDSLGLGPGYVNAVRETRDGSVWVGTAGSGLYRLRPDHSRFDRFLRSTDGANGLPDDYVTFLLEGRDGAIWIGTRSRGIAFLAPDGSEPRRYVTTPGDLDATAQQHVSSILESRAGSIWVGTLGGGIYRLDRHRDGLRTTRYDETSGLPNDNVAALLEDDDGSIWISTRRGLARLGPESESIATWGLDDGLPSAVFGPGSAWLGRSSLHFGTREGVLSIRRGTPFPTLEPSPTAITTLRTLDGPVRAERPVWEVDRISIPYGEVLFVDYALLDFRGADRHRFAYRLGEGESPWVDMGNRRSLTFTDLDPGEHLLTIRGRNANGVTSEIPRPLVIDVVPPFWMTRWFQLSVLALVLGAAWTGHRVRTVALERRNRILEALQQEKQEALDEARTSQRELHAAYDRLRALTRRLEAAKEDERRHIARELHDEMGQALSATKINLKALGRLPEAAGRAERLADTVALVDGMISHVRALSLDLRPPLLDELGLVASLRTYAEAQALRTGVRIEVEANADALDVPADIAIAAFRIVQEGVNNVLRHARATRVTVSVRRDVDRLALSVVDDGRGFDVGEAMGRAAAGGHLGLLGMRERVEALGGTFEVESVPGHGAEVRAVVPLEQEGEDE